MNDWREALADRCPQPLHDWVLTVNDDLAGRATELRLRAGRQPMLCAGREEAPLAQEMVTPELLSRTLSHFSGHSLYSRQKEIAQGYLTLPGGFRVGIAGSAVVADGQVSAIGAPSSLTVRIMRAIVGCAAPLCVRLYGPGYERFASTLILSPPGMGKTTLLRDMVRVLSDGGHRVGLADERGEVASLSGGSPQLDVGARTDVLGGCPKHEAIPMLVRTMAPDLVACDEIGRAQDAGALAEAVLSGVKILATAHGSDEQAALRKGELKRLVEVGAFERFVVLGGRPGQVVRVVSRQGRAL